MSIRETETSSVEIASAQSGRDKAIKMIDQAVATEAGSLLLTTAIEVAPKTGARRSFQCQSMMLNYSPDHVMVFIEAGIKQLFEMVDPDDAVEMIRQETNSYYNKKMEQEQ
jgi:hypothetical protein